MNSKSIKDLLGPLGLVVLVLGVGAYFYLILGKIEVVAVAPKQYNAQVIDSQMKKGGYFDQTVYLNAPKSSNAAPPEYRPGELGKNNLTQAE